MNSLKMKLNDLVLRLDNLIIYKNLLKDSILNKLYQCANDILDEEDMRLVYRNYNEFIIELIDKAEELGFSGNIFGKYIAYIMIKDENVFSIVCENNLIYENSTIYAMASYEISTVNIFLNLDFKRLSSFIGIEWDFSNYVSLTTKESDFNDFINLFCNKNDLENNFEKLIKYYRNMGIGIFSTSKLFILDSEYDFQCIKKYDNLRSNDLLFYDTQKIKIKNIINDFVNEDKKRNILLSGEIGTSKLNFIIAVANEYRDVKVIKIIKRNFSNIEKIIKSIVNRNKKFIILLDDLIYEDYSFLSFIIQTYSELNINNIMFFGISDFMNSSNEDVVFNRKRLSNMFDEDLYFPYLNKEQFKIAVDNVLKNNNLSINISSIDNEIEEWIETSDGLTYKNAVKFVYHINQ